MWRLLLKTANVYVSVHLHVVSSKKATNVHVSVHLHVVSSKKKYTLTCTFVAFVRRHYM
jgi:hypothetical protein